MVETLSLPKVVETEGVEATANSSDTLRMKTDLSSNETFLMAASIVPDDLYPVLEMAILACERHRRHDIIITYVCNLQANPKNVAEMATDLELIAQMKVEEATCAFVPIKH